MSISFNTECCSRWSGVQFHYARYRSQVPAETRQRQLDTADTQRLAVASIAESYYLGLTHSIASATSQMSYSSVCVNHITFSALFKLIIFISQSVELVRLPCNYKLITCVFAHISIKTETNVIRNSLFSIYSLSNDSL